MSKAKTLPVIFVGEGDLAATNLPTPQRAWAEANGFSGQRGRLLALPEAGGALSGYLFGTGADAGRPALVAGLAGAALTEGIYRLEGAYGDPRWRRSASALAPIATTATGRASLRQR
jgi:leucyl aminopeptidase